MPNAWIKDWFIWSLVSFAEYIFNIHRIKQNDFEWDIKNWLGFNLYLVWLDVYLSSMQSTIDPSVQAVCIKIL